MLACEVGRVTWTREIDIVEGGLLCIYHCRLGRCCGPQTKPGMTKTPRNCAERRGSLWQLSPLDVCPAARLSRRVSFCSFPHHLVRFWHLSCPAVRSLAAGFLAISPLAAASGGDDPPVLLVYWLFSPCSLSIFLDVP